jgi:hypothetical protein
MTEQQKDYLIGKLLDDNKESSDLQSAYQRLYMAEQAKVAKLSEEVVLLQDEINELRQPSATVNMQAVEGSGKE